MSDVKFHALHTSVATIGGELLEKLTRGQENSRLDYPIPQFLLLLQTASQHLRWPGPTLAPTAMIKRALLCCIAMVQS